MHKRTWILVWSILLIAVLTACGDDSDTKSSTPTPAIPTVSGAPALNTGGNVGDGTGSQLPGCSDPDDTECPVPLNFDLDGEASAGGASVNYPARYFVATTNEEGDIPIEIGPSENHKFAEKATFQVYYTASIAAALAELTDPEVSAWQTDAFSEGTIGVVKDDTQDPPVNTTIGAFALPDGRAIVLKAITTGKYGWDLYTRLYEGMLNSLAVSS